MLTRCSLFGGEAEKIWISGCMLMQPYTRFQNSISPFLIEFLWKYIAELEEEFAWYLWLKNRNIVGSFLNKRGKGELARDNWRYMESGNFEGRLNHFSPLFSLMKIELSRTTWVEYTLRFRYHFGEGVALRDEYIRIYSISVIKFRFSWHIFPIFFFLLFLYRILSGRRNYPLSV